MASPKLACVMSDSILAFRKFSLSESRKVILVLTLRLVALKAQYNMFKK